MTGKTANQWYAYRNEEQLGPYSWEKLWQEARAGRINSGDQIWNNEQVGWIKADQVPGLIIKTALDPHNPPPPPVLKPAASVPPLPGKNKNSRAVIAGAAIFAIIALAAIFLVINMAGNRPEVAETAYEIGYPVYEETEEPDHEENGIYLSDQRLDWSVADLDDEFFAAGKGYETIEPAAAEDEIEEAEPAGEPASEPDPSGSDAAPAPETDASQPESDDPQEATIALLGGTYTGPLKDGLAHGEGRWTHPEGRVYVGNFNHGQIEGFGTMTFPGGERYVGSFKNGVAHGEGTMTHPDGRRVSGVWINGTLTQ